MLHVFGSAPQATLLPVILISSCVTASSTVFADSATSLKRSPGEDQSGQGLVLYHQPDWHVLLHRADTPTGQLLRSQLLCVIKLHRLCTADRLDVWPVSNPSRFQGPL